MQRFCADTRVCCAKIHQILNIYMSKVNEALVNELFEAGAHVGYSKTKRHPSTREFIFTSRQKKDVINLEKTAAQLEDALSFISEIKKNGGQILFVGTKAEAKRVVREQAEFIDMPHVTERWLGGTLTNRRELRNRVNRLVNLTEQSEKGELVAATKKEKLMLEREIEKLEKKFGGLKTMKFLPSALFVIDPKKEYIAVDEANQMGIPVIALANTDCDVTKVTKPIVSNDSNLSVISLISKKVADSLK